MGNLKHPYLVFVSGSQNSSLSSAMEGSCVLIPSLDTENSSSEVPSAKSRFLSTGLGLPGTWTGAQSKHVHKSLCISLFVAIIWQVSCLKYKHYSLKSCRSVLIHQASVGTLLLQGEIHL